MYGALKRIFFLDYVSRVLIVLLFQGPLMVHVTKLYPNYDAAVFQALGRVLSATPYMIIFTHSLPVYNGQLCWVRTTHWRMRRTLK